ncbi:hypothetical protein HDK77DRAFT_208962 [Phyllosticta capitalensis]
MRYSFDSIIAALPVPSPGHCLMRSFAMARAKRSEPSGRQGVKSPPSVQLGLARALSRLPTFCRSPRFPSSTSSFINVTGGCARPTTPSNNQHWAGSPWCLSTHTQIWSWTSTAIVGGFEVQTRPHGTRAVWRRRSGLRGEAGVEALRIGAPPASARLPVDEVLELSGVRMDVEASAHEGHRLTTYHPRLGDHYLDCTTHVRQQHGNFSGRLAWCRGRGRKRA